MGNVRIEQLESRRLLAVSLSGASNAGTLIGRSTFSDSLSSSNTSDVRKFTADGESRTRVELEHRALERHGDGWESMRDAVGSPNGWGDGLRSFAAYVAG